MKPTIIQVNARLRWVAWHGEAGWCAECEEPSLGASVFADTKDEMMESIHETMDLIFRQMAKDGSLTEFLGKNGWSLKKPIPKKGRFRFDVRVRVQVEPPGFEIIMG